MHLNVLIGAVTALLCAGGEAGPRMTQEAHRPGHEEGRESGGESEESGTRYELSETAREARSGIDLVIGYDAVTGRFRGELTNTTAASVANVRVEIHLSNGVEIGPTPRVTIEPNQKMPVELAATGQRFTTWSVHIEIGTGEH